MYSTNITMVVDYMGIDIRDTVQFRIDQFLFR